ncbi:sanguinarine reductase [Impatiens glandulifera]|uniref:sanguinarine reductase n=1 Tax=Impatiens glandulifera TaxID=253017 RepID=UPI001FB0C211|nr:sanguinarine reductase [Impatiens glandulifera]
MASTASLTSLAGYQFPPENLSKVHRKVHLPSTIDPRSSVFGKFLSGISISREKSSPSSLLCYAVEQQQQIVTSSVPESINDSETTNPASSKVVLVVGGTGGVGQLVVASLLSRNIKSCLLLRDPEKASTLFGEHEKEKLQVCKGDTRNPKELNPTMFEGVTHVICCTGTTAFPSRRWDGDNTPERVDWEGVRNLVSVLPSSLKRIVLVSSIGVTKYNEIPWSIMNLFGVLKYKKMGEDFVIKSGLPYTIIRPGRLTDGPYTSYDLNTLLKATAGERRAVLLGQGDKLVGEVSRIIVAEACIQALDIESTQGQIYEINSIPGEGPGNDTGKWQELFEATHQLQ